jgi:hypothetical protein
MKASARPLHGARAITATENRRTTRDAMSPSPLAAVVVNHAVNRVTHWRASPGKGERDET